MVIDDYKWVSSGFTIGVPWEFDRFLADHLQNQAEEFNVPHAHVPLLLPLAKNVQWLASS